jgi:hypothetical protein
VEVTGDGGEDDDHRDGRWDRDRDPEERLGRDERARTTRRDRGATRRERDAAQAFDERREAGEAGYSSLTDDEFLDTVAIGRWRSVVSQRVRILWAAYVERKRRQTDFVTLLKLVATIAGVATGLYGLWRAFRGG